MAGVRWLWADMGGGFGRAKPQSLFARMESLKKAGDAGKLEGEKEGEGDGV